MHIENGVRWMVMGSALVAGCNIEEPVRHVTSMYATTELGEAVALRGVGIERATYDELTAALGREPVGIGLDPDAPDGTVLLHLAPSSPLVARYLGAPAGTALPPLSITLEDGSPEPIALLLPAVQKIREAAVHGSGPSAHTLDLTLDASATLAGGVQVAAGDVTGDGTADAPVSVFGIGTPAPGTSPEQRAEMGAAFMLPTSITRAHVVADDDAFVLDDLVVRDSALAGLWGATRTTLDLRIDTRTTDPQTDGLLLIRYAVPRATEGANTSARAHVRVFDGKTGQLARSGDAERAMFDAGFATFSSDAYDQAGRVISTYASTATTSQAVQLWTSGRTQALADLVAATGAGGAPGYEAMACVSALPAALVVAKTLDLGDDARASAVASTIEALRSVTPAVGLVAGGEIAMQAYGATAPSGDAQPACAAIQQLASLPEALESTGGMALRTLAIELGAFDARHLDIQIAAWIAAMDALVLSPDDGAWAEAKQAAELLVTSLGQASARTEARWSLAKAMLGR